MKFDLTLYGITDSSYKSIPLEEQIRAAVLGGALMIQLREKDISDGEFLRKAVRARQITKALGAKLIINDRTDIAARSGADGVHLGQSDGSPGEARRRLGENAIIGVTAKTVEQARKAEAEGADYLGSGAMFVSTTKPDAAAMSCDTLKAICSSVNIPVAAIGGISADNAVVLAGTGIKGIAAVSSLFGYENANRIRIAAQQLRAVSEVICGE
ncbi:MAG: thiamine phosphate synthase [Huintestinicola sp.]